MGKISILISFLLVLIIISNVSAEEYMDTTEISIHSFIIKECDDNSKFFFQLEIDGELSDNYKYPASKSNYIELNAGDNKTVNYSFNLEGSYDSLYLLVIHDVGFGDDENFAEVRIDMISISEVLYENTLVNLVYSVNYTQEMIETNTSWISSIIASAIMSFMFYVLIIIVIIIVVIILLKSSNILELS